jgi:hypothetical protein
MVASIGQSRRKQPLRALPNKKKEKTVSDKKLNPIKYFHVENIELTQEQIDSIYVYLENFIKEMTAEEIQFWMNFLEKNDKTFFEDE